MKSKTLITIATCLLFMLAGVSAFAGERVYIREYVFGAAKSKVFIWQKGVTTQKEFATGIYAKDEAKIENLNEFASMLEGYLNQGFKIVSVVNKGIGATSEVMTEYILEKQ